MAEATPESDPTADTAATTTNMDATEAATANFVYLRSDEHAWIPAKVVEQQQSDNKENEDTAVTVKIPIYKNEQQIVSDGGRTAVRFRKETISLSDYNNHALPLQNVDEQGKLIVVEDMVDLAFLHEVRAELYQVGWIECCV